MVNPLLGLVFHWVGGLSSGSFYVPYRAVRLWPWEVFWLTGGVCAWVVAPWMFAALQTVNLIEVLRATPPRTLSLCYAFGALWGIGAVSFGLTMRYLGMSLGMAITLALTAAFGTLVPPLVSGDLFGTLIHLRSGRVVLSGVALSLIAILVVGAAGRRRERETRFGPHQASTAEFDFRKGVPVAILAGVVSSCFAYGLAAGGPIRELSVAQGTHPLWQGLPVLTVVLLGGFTINLIWCAGLMAKNKSAGVLTGHADPIAAHPDRRLLLLRNYLLCALAGLAWYLQFFFYTMGESQMGSFSFSSWSLHISSVIIFSSLWGFGLGEWRGASARTRTLLWVGIAVLLASTLIIAMGNSLAAQA